MKSFLFYLVNKKQSFWLLFSFSNHSSLVVI